MTNFILSPNSEPVKRVYVACVDGVILGHLTGESFEGKHEVKFRRYGYSNYLNFDASRIFGTRKEAAAHFSEVAA